MTTAMSGFLLALGYSSRTASVKNREATGEIDDTFFFSVVNPRFASDNTAVC